MSTQDLLLAIEEAVGNGETSFEIEASGQHDIGGPLWNREGKALRFHVTNPGQRVGSMCLDNTEILVDGPAPGRCGLAERGRPHCRARGCGRHRRALRGGGRHPYRRPGRGPIRFRS